MKKSFEKNYSEYYDYFYLNKDYKNEVEYIIKLFNKYGDSIKTIRDIACGTGNHLIHFLEKGFDIDGSDISKDMIKICEKKIKNYFLAEKPNLEIVSMLNFHSLKKYDAVLCLFAAINYLKNLDEIDKLLKLIHKNIKQGGLFIFDFWNGFLVPGNHNSKGKKIYKINDDLNIVRNSSTYVEIVNQKCKVEYEIQIIEKNKTKCFTEEHNICFFTPQQIIHLLNNNGFYVELLSPYLKIKDISINDWEILIVAKKV